jgi:small basic protein
MEKEIIDTKAKVFVVSFFFNSYHWFKIVYLNKKYEI